MKSLTEIYRQGMGPMSSLNLVPYRACLETAQEIHMKRLKLSHVEVILYNEYARLKDQAGILTDIEYAFAYSNFKYVVTSDKPTPENLKDEPYVFDIVVYDKPNSPLFRHRVVATGAGNFTVSGHKKAERIPYSTFEEVRKWFKDNPGKSYLDFANLGDDRDELKALYYRGVSFAEIACLQGIRKHGELELGDKNIHYMRQARNIWLHDENFLSPTENANRMISAFAYAISEEILEKRVIVAAPTLCTSSVIWSIILYLHNAYDVNSKKMINAFCAAGIFASLVDCKASLEPSVVGCQGPMGVACGMAAVIVAVVLYNADIEECGRVFEMALEHSLGIICDALTGLPIIPCVQRCAAFATRAFELAVLNHSLMKTPELCKVDDLIQVLMETGSDLIPKNRRLGMGGFADHAKYSLEKPTEKDFK
ncbi:MAG: L-serine ammonia-lyase, iron-sulfur-dependent, subunit beta [Mycoplasmoidaceae bacterium]